MPPWSLKSNGSVIASSASSDSAYSTIAVRSRSRSGSLSLSQPLSPFHYQLGDLWRMPMHKMFRTFIYAFTWEDPTEDMRHMNVTRDDSVLCITSAGDNALHYAINGRPKRIHCVDLNPCQGHLLELKLASIQALEYDDFFRMFGKGKHPHFRTLLDSRISPYLSSHAYTFWRMNAHAFEDGLYTQGYTGWVLNLTRYLFRLAGVESSVRALCASRTLAEQQHIYTRRLRPVLLNRAFVRLVLNSPVFLWNALGIPMNQRQLFMQEGTAWEYLRDTLDPLAGHELFSEGAYHYLLCLLGHYTPASCPDYLTRRGFDALKKGNGAAMRAFRIHTDSITNVLRSLTSGSLTHVIVMDHLDWFSPDSPDVEEEVAEIHRALSRGGAAYWRSAARRPWYNSVQVRKGGV